MHAGGGLAQSVMRNVWSPLILLYFHRGYSDTSCNTFDEISALQVSSRVLVAGSSAPTSSIQLPPSDASSEDVALARAARTEQEALKLAEQALQLAAAAQRTERAERTNEFYLDSVERERATRVARDERAPNAAELAKLAALVADEQANVAVVDKRIVLALELFPLAGSIGLTRMYMNCWITGLAQAVVFCLSCGMLGTIWGMVDMVILVYSAFAHQSSINILAMVANFTHRNDNITWILACIVPCMWLFYLCLCSFGCYHFYHWLWTKLPKKLKSLDQHELEQHAAAHVAKPEPKAEDSAEASASGNRGT